VKRSIGVREGYHSNEHYLDKYERALRDRSSLEEIKGVLQALLGDTTFQFNMVESFGQPRAEQKQLVALESGRAGLRAIAAPSGTAGIPAYDIPCFEITQTRYRIPLTFGFFLALRLRHEGCANSSLPASVRAAIDRVRHRFAGDLCRDDSRFADGTASIRIGPSRTSVWSLLE
jgi:hypothetical protein